MKKLRISFLLLLASLVLYWFGLYLADLAYIGGYDGVAPEELSREFWYGKYSGTAWYEASVVGALAALAVGFLGTISSLIAMIYFFAREIFKHVRKVL